ncbi:MAG: MerR family transcriptional regulator [Chloroflexi bacterium]|nr:MerR family transcriptional regulator [Chloroflexota bacterium]
MGQGRRSERRFKITPEARAGSAGGAVQSPQGLYVISVASRMLNMHPQTLRKYERLGRVTPYRTLGMLRLYSDEDIVRLRMIKDLVEQRGINLAGVEIALSLARGLLELRQGMSALLRGEEEARVRTEQSLAELLRMLYFPIPLARERGTDVGAGPGTARRSSEGDETSGPPGFLNFEWTS